MSSNSSRIPLLDTVSWLAAGREAWLVDVWGVLHDGITPFPAAGEACRRFREGGGKVVLVSNAPRPAASVTAQLDRIGVARDVYDAVISSGDTARSLISDLGPRALFHLGPGRDLPLFEGLEAVFAEAHQAEAVVCTGLFDDERESPEDYTGLLGSFARRKLPMICANPDLYVVRAGKRVPCAGTLAKIYEQAGGLVHYAGKPYPAIYVLAFAAVERLLGRPAAKEKVLAIGDGIYTDIAGAAAVGIDAVYIASGVHADDGEPLTGATLAALFPETGAAGRPLAALPALAW